VDLYSALSWSQL